MKIERGQVHLVTGGAGFIGSHLCRRLLQMGARVIALDNFFTGRARNIADLKENPEFSLVTHDVTKPFVPDDHIDAIWNLACPASPPAYQHDPVATHRTSVLGMINMLDLAKDRGVPVLQASTSEIYGDPLEHPQKETYWGNVNPLSIRACYDEGKRSAETLCMDYHRQYGVAIKIVRIFNTYGPAMDPNDGRVVSNFIVQALLGKPITIYGDGSQTRSFQYVDDLINGMVAMFQTPNFIGPVNLGNPGEFMMIDLAYLVKDLTGSQSSIVHHPLPEGDPKQRCPDISLAKARLIWEPKIPLREGLLRTIPYFKQALAR